MPRPSLRTRSRGRQRLRLPGGRIGIHSRQGKAGASYCPRCGQKLSGVPRLTPSKLHKLSTSQKRINRIYGRRLCHGCIRNLLKHAVRNI